MERRQHNEDIQRLELEKERNKIINNNKDIEIEELKHENKEIRIINNESEITILKLEDKLNELLLLLDDRNNIIMKYNENNETIMIDYNKLQLEIERIKSDKTVSSVIDQLEIELEELTKQMIFMNNEYEELVNEVKMLKQELLKYNNTEAKVLQIILDTLKIKSIDPIIKNNIQQLLTSINNK